MARKFNYKPEYDQLLINHMSRGMSFDSFGAEVNSSRQTLYNWVEHFPSFKEAKELAYVKCMKFWETMGLYGTIGIDEIKVGSKTHSLKKFNITGWIFNMKNRFGWKDKSEIDLSGDAVKVIFDVPRSQFVNPAGFKKKKEAQARKLLKKKAVKKLNKKNAPRNKTISTPTKAKRVQRKQS